MVQQQPTISALVVDDSEVVRELLIRLLRYTFPVDWRFVEAGDGAEGLEKLNPKRTQMIFLDWNMPRLSGPEFLRRLRERRGTDHLRVVMVTGRTLVGDIEKALDRYQVDAYVTKPFGALDLERRLGSLIQSVMEPEAAPRPSLLARVFGG